MEVKQVMGNLIDRLTEENSRLQLDWDGDIIKAATVGYGENYDVSVVFSHDRSEIEYGADIPTRREYLVEQMSGFADKGWAQLTYEEKKLKISEFCDGDGLMSWNRSWVESNDNQEIDKSTDTEERLNQWLDEEIEDNGDCNVIEYVVGQSGDSVSEYLHGLEIYEFLSEAERAHLGMTLCNLGGPAHGDHPAVRLSEVDKLEGLFLNNDLPFYFKSRVKS